MTARLAAELTQGLWLRAQLCGDGRDVSCNVGDHCGRAGWVAAGQPEPGPAGPVLYSVGAAQRCQRPLLPGCCTFLPVQKGAALRSWHPTFALSE